MGGSSRRRVGSTWASPPLPWLCWAVVASACLALFTSLTISTHIFLWRHESFHGQTIGYRGRAVSRRRIGYPQAVDRQASQFIHGTAHTLPPDVDDDLIEPPMKRSQRDTTHTVISSDGSLTRFAVPADEQDPEEVKRAGARRSKAAHAFSQSQFPEVEFSPVGGPVDKIMPPPQGDEGPLPGKYRVVVTADCQVYGRWQVLVHYYWYRRHRADFPGSAMGGYTRILHCPEADDVMHLVPTVQVEQLPPGLDRGYGPMHRPWAFTQWLSRMHVPEQYILMTEPDHILISPPPLLATPTRPVGYYFQYVNCSKAVWRPHCEDVRYNEHRVPVESIYPIGNAPAIVSTDMLIEMVPRWDRLIRAIHADPVADAALGWAQEMFAFTLALANSPGGPPEVLLDPFLMAQPPFDRAVTIDMCLVNKMELCDIPEDHRFRNRSILHYTYRQNYDASGQATNGTGGAWHWDKREYAGAYPTLPISNPPPGSPETIVQLVELIGRAGMSLEYWPWWKANMAAPG